MKVFERFWRQSFARRSSVTRWARPQLEELEPRVQPSHTPPSLSQTYQLVAVSGTTATLLVGGEQPTPQSDGHGGTNVVFDPFGAQLQFSPTVLDDGSIDLNVNVQESVLTNTGGIHNGGTSVAGQSTLDVNTSVNVQSGQTVTLVSQPSVPFVVLATPQLIVGPASSKVVSLSVTVTEPMTMVNGLPAAVRPGPPGQTPVSQTYQLVTLSGATGTLLLGGQQPVPQSDGQGGTTVAFEPFGLQLDVVPTLLDGGAVSLQIQLEQSALDPTSGSRINGNTIAGQIAIALTTTVALGDGQTIVLGQDEGLPLEVLVSPRVIVGPGGTVVAVNVTINEPHAFFDTLPTAFQPVPSGQTIAQQNSVTAQNGQTGTLTQGGEQPMPHLNAQGQVTLQFVPFGTLVTFVPTVLESGAIMLNFDIQQSTLDSGSGAHIGNIAVAGRIELAVDTSVDLQNGQTIVLGQDAGLPFLVEATVQVVAGSNPETVSVTVSIDKPKR